MSGYCEIFEEEAREHMSCFGEYYDEDGNVCKNGESGLCIYCEVCRRNCIYY